MSDQGRACQTCRYGVKRVMYDEVFFECHRYPPLERRFPVVLPLEWCGEYMSGRPGGGKR